MINKISDHSKERIRERVNTSKRNVELAIERGKSVDEFKGSFRRYLDKLRHNHDRYFSNVIVYGNEIYIYTEHNETLATVIKIPSRYLKCLSNKNG